MKLAVIGAGPKALFCLERLAAEIDQRPVSGLELHVFEPHSAPGAGPNYDPAEPEILSMNLANRAIDLWPPHEARRPAHARTFIEFEAEAGRTAHPHAFSSRASVGRYLTDGFERVIGALRASASVCLHRETVERVARVRSSFVVTAASGDIEVDEVLIATGHASQTDRTSTSSHIAVYPVSKPGGVLDIPTGTRVLIRGMGLTALDAVLALTEGRGGTFRERGGQSYRYRRGPNTVDCITIGSRTNRPMVPKPARCVEINEDRYEWIWAAAREQIVDLGRSDSPVQGIRRALVNTADAVLRAMNVDASPADACLDHHLARQPLDPDEAAHAVRTYTEFAFGRRQASTSTMLGTTWRRCYPAIVELAATRALDQDWRAFSRIATELEPLAFGPPPDSAARLCALLDDDVLAIAPATETSRDLRTNDVRLDAVLDAPGIAPSPSPLIESLIEGGLATRRGDTPGLAVRADGTCIGLDGRPAWGLAAVGRPTEGSILGNDTLDRRLHDLPARWAAAIVERHADCASRRTEQP